jgi:hypothetical protein
MFQRLVLTFFALCALASCGQTDSAPKLEATLNSGQLRLTTLTAQRLEINLTTKNLTEAINASWTNLPIGVLASKVVQTDTQIVYSFTVQEDAVNTPAADVRLSLTSTGLTKLLLIKMEVQGKKNYRINSESLKAIELTPGSTKKLPISIQRVNGFDEPISVTFSKLPTGVSSETMIIPADASSTELELRVDSTVDSIVNFNSLLKLSSLSIPNVEYEIQLSAIGVPDYQVSIDPPGWQFQGSGQKNFNVTVIRRNGFNKEINLEFLDLIPGYRSKNVIIKQDESSAIIQIETSIATSHRPNGFPAKFRASGGQIIKEQDVVLSMWNPNQEGPQFGIGLVSTDVPAPGEQVIAEVEVVYDIAQRGVNFNLTNNNTGEVIPLNNVTTELSEVEWYEGRYTATIKFDAPKPIGSTGDYSFNAKAIGSSNAYSRVNLYVRSKVKNLNAKLIQTLYVHPGCISSGAYCGTGANIFSADIYSELGQIPNVGDQFIAIPGFATPRVGYENGFNKEVTWSLVGLNGKPTVGNLSKKGAFWYYDAPYELKFLQEPVTEVGLKAISVADPEISQTYLLQLRFFNIIPYSWPTTTIQDSSELQLRIQPLNRLISKTYTLDWSVDNQSTLLSTVGANGKLSQSGCLTPPKLAPSETRNITVIAAVREIPGLVVRQTIQIQQGNTSNGVCGNFVDENGWTP